MAIRQSETISALIAGRVKAQSKITGAAKDSINPHFKSKYADLAAVNEACIAALAEQGIAVLQPVTSDGGATVTVTTMLAHTSGEWMAADLAMTATQNTPQAIGSCITYARRYGLAAMVGVAPEDDDGQAASVGRPAPKDTQSAPQGYGEWLVDLEATADNGPEALKKVWTDSKPAFRKHLTETAPETWDAIKQKATRAGLVSA